MSLALALLSGAAWRGAVLVAVALLVTLGMRRSSAAARHAVLSLGIVAHLLVPLTLLMAPRLPLPYPVPEAKLVERSVVEAGASALTIEPPGEGWSAAAVPADATSAGPAGARFDVVWALLLWVCGASLILGRYGVGLSRVARLRARSRPAHERIPGGVIAGAARAAGLKRTQVRLADVSLPFACGVLRPAVLLPEVAIGWSEERLRMVLMHEMAHVRRRDVAVQGLAQLACAVFWFDPLVWIVRRRLRDEAERASDDAVLRAGTPADRYVLELVELLRETSLAPYPIAVASIGRGLRARASRALDADVRRGDLRRRPLLAGLTLALVATLFVGAASPSVSEAGDPLPDGLATGCPWRPGDRHVNRWTEEQGRPRWQVLWQGDDCQVEMLAEPGASLAGGILAPPSAGGRVAVSVRRGASTDSVVLRREGKELRMVASPGLAGGGPITGWLRSFAAEVALHTAFDAPTKVDALLATGGVSAVLEYAGSAQGDHAAGVYLTELVGRRSLDDRQLERLLRVAAGHVSNDAVMSGLLRSVSERHPVGARGSIRDAFDHAAATLRSRAAREAVQRLD